MSLLYQDNAGKITEVVVKVNDSPAQVYKKSPTPGEDYCLTCFIAVNPGDSVSVYFREPVTKADAVDLLVDGIVRDTWVATQDVAACSISRTFTHAFVEAGRAGVLRRGVMTVKRVGLDLKREYFLSEAVEPTLGTIELRFSRRNQRNTTHQMNSPSCVEVQDWRDVRVTTLGTAGIEPDCFMGFDQQRDPDPVARDIFRQQVDEPRPGIKPRMTFKFFYRSPLALRTAGILSEESHLQQAQQSDRQTSTVSLMPCNTLQSSNTSESRAAGTAANPSCRGTPVASGCPSTDLLDETQLGKKRSLVQDLEEEVAELRAREADLARRAEELKSRYQAKLRAEYSKLDEREQVLRRGIQETRERISKHQQVLEAVGGSFGEEAADEGFIKGEQE